MSKNPKITDEEIALIKSAQAGNVPAFNKLFYKYKDFVTNILYQYIKDLDESKDMANFVFTKVFEKLSQFREYSSFGGWLRILTNRVAIDYLREMKNKALVLGDSDCRLTAEESSSSMEDDLVNRMTYEQLLSLIKKLPYLTRKVCMLFYANNMTVGEISKALNVPVGSVKSILFRTRSKIKKQLNY